MSDAALRTLKAVGDEAQECGANGALCLHVEVERPEARRGSAALLRQLRAVIHDARGSAIDSHLGAAGGARTASERKAWGRTSCMSVNMRLRVAMVGNGVGGTEVSAQTGGRELA